MQSGNSYVLKIETKRLELHKISEHHRLWFFELLSNPALLRYVSDKPSQEEIELQFLSRLKPWSLESQHWLTLSVFEKISGNFVGINGFKHFNGCASVGFIFLPRYHGLGYATESLKSVCEFAHSLGIRELEASITKGNSASEKVVEKCGFVFSNELSGIVKIGSKSHNDLQYKKVSN
ncbi:MAG: N-acetyltransferase [Gammaproteobacteria bacterium]|nr:MAG: N-acetyltransferase [Gammaproteobacteria bacterium]